MITVSEISNSSGNYYIIEEHIGPATLRERVAYYARTAEQDGKTAMCIFDSNLNPVSAVYDFLNGAIGNEPQNTREKAMYALKYLYSYLGIMKKQLEDLTETDIKGLIDFLHGYSYTGNEYTFVLKTKRSAQTINQYLAVFREFMSAEGIECPALFMTAGTWSRMTETGSGVSYTTRYKINEKQAVHNEVPKYISINEFQNIIGVIRMNPDYTLRDEIIVRLMFENGLRIGEVLGLTTDDVVTEETKEGVQTVVYIRNRKSDSRYQSAKTVINVRDTSQYRSREYKTENYGWQYVIISDSLAECIDSYINEAHSAAMQSHKDNYVDAKADRVRQSKPYEEENAYIFLNKHGRRLTQQMWNVTLRKIFKDAGIPVDKGTKENNLNHRFRHGCAMYHIQYLHYGPMEVMALLRHHSIVSGECYFRPTVKDKIETKQKLETELSKIFDWQADEVKDDKSADEAADDKENYGGKE